MHRPRLQRQQRGRCKRASDPVRGELFTHQSGLFGIHCFAASAARRVNTYARIASTSSTVSHFLSEGIPAPWYFPSRTISRYLSKTVG